MLVKTILVKFLTDNGYDGLCNPDAECGCGIDDLAPCGSSFLGCKAAYKSKNITEQSRDCDEYYTTVKK